ncbi:MAG: glycosyltransferase [Candidatus Marinimicrobia bacterium]|nr:glycosyltransferase [Candidatus Neomarinimicrobiota bacterium]
MRLSIVSVGPPFRGGISDLSALIYEQLNLTHEVQFINYSRQYPRLLFPGKTEYKIGKLASDFHSERILDSINPISWFKAVGEIQSHQSAWVLFRYWNPFFAPLIAIMSRLLKKRGIKVAVLVDNLIPHEESIIDSWMARSVLAGVNHVFTMSAAVSRDVQAHKSDIPTTTLFHPLYEIYKTKLTKQEARTALKLPNHPVILFFGLIRPYKGLDILIKALGTIHGQFGSYSAFILGEAYEDAQRYSDLIESEGIASNVVFKNEFILDDDLPLYFTASDVLVLPYRTATQSGIVGIAFQMDRPVIATNVGGLGEYIKEGVTGYLVDSENPEQLGQAILKFFSGDDRERMSASVRSTKDKYSIHSFCSGMMQVMDHE